MNVLLLKCFEKCTICMFNKCLCCSHYCACYITFQNCKLGAVNLNEMLRVRKPLKEDRDEVETNSEDVFELLKNG